MSNIDVSNKSNVKASSSDSTDIGPPSRNPVKTFFWVIWKIIEIPLYVFIWIGREFVRLFSFLSGSKQNKNRPLDHKEIAFVESVPIFLILTGVTLSLIIGILAYFRFSTTISNFFDSLNHGTGAIGDLVSALWNGAIQILTAIVDAIVYIITVIYNTIKNFITSDPLLTLLVIVIVVFLLVMLFLAISELGFHRIILRRLGLLGLGLVDLPRALYISLDILWLKILKTVGRTIVGGEELLTMHSRRLYQRVVWIVCLYALWTFTWGILFLFNQFLTTGNQVTQNSNKLLDAVIYLLFVLLVSGIISGTLLMAVLSRAIKILSGDKYNVDKKTLDQARHDSLVEFLLPKSKTVWAIDLDTLSKVVDIPKNELAKHWSSDKKLSEWKLYSTHVVNEAKYRKYSEKIDALENDGLEREDIKPLIKAVDNVAYLQKGFRSVPDISSDLQERKELISEDIADLRGHLLAKQGYTVQSAQGSTK